MIQMVYQKANGQIVKRIRNTMAPYKIGDRTSMGWIVIDIKYLYRHKYYPKYEYDKLIARHFVIQKRKSKILKVFTRLYKQLVYCLVLLILFRIFELTTHIS